MSDLKKVFGINVRRIRTSKNLRSLELAAKLNVQPGYLSKLESGQIGFTADSLPEYAAALEVEPWELLRPHSPPTAAENAEAQSIQALAKANEELKKENKTLKAAIEKLGPGFLEAVAQADEHEIDIIREAAGVGGLTQSEQKRKPRNPA